MKISSASVILKDASSLGVNLDISDPTRGPFSESTFMIDRATALGLRNDLNRYIKAHERPGVVLHYNSRDGWSWIFRAGPKTAGFTTEEAARADLKSKGYQVYGEPTNGN